MYKNVLRVLSILGILYGGHACAATACVDLPMDGGYPKIPHGTTCYHPADEYRFSLKGIGLQREDGTVVWIVNQTQEFNAAGKNVNAEMGSYVFNGALPEGTYKAIVPIIDENFHVSALDDFKYHIDGGGGGLMAPPSTPPASVHHQMGTIGMSNCDATTRLPTGGNTECYHAGTGSMIILHSDGFAPFTIGPNTTVALQMGFDTSKGFEVAIDGGGTASHQLGSLNVTMIPSTSEPSSKG